jgi:sugar phosphate permease
VPSAVIAKWFIRNRGKAIGIFVTAGGLSGMLAPILSHMIGLYGWQRTLLIIGVFSWLMVMPISLILRGRPEDYGLYPDGKPPTPTTENLKNNGGAEYGEVDFSIRKALWTPAFLLLSVTFWSFQVTMSSVFVHLVPHLINAGIGEKTASIVVMFTTLCSVLEKIRFGWLSDSINKKNLFISTFVLQAIGLFVFSRVSKIVHLLSFLAAYAPGYGGTVALRAPIVGEYYGRKNFGALFGVLIGIAMFGGIIGPIVAGFAYDYFGNFRGVFTFFSIINFFSALVLFFLKRPRPVL